MYGVRWTKLQKGKDVKTVNSVPKGNMVAE